MIAGIALSPLRWQPLARERGYVPARMDGPWHDLGIELCRGTLGLRNSGGWLEVVSLGTEAPMQRVPGPWREVGPGAAPRIFDLPLLAASEAEDEDEPTDAAKLFESLLDWAHATADGAVPAGWRPPPASELADAFGGGGLVARAEAWTAHGEVVSEAERLCLRFPELARIPEELPAARREWIGALCRDLALRWRLVRAGIAATGDRVYAEVDLTGVPSHCARSLFVLAGEALTGAAAWALPSFSLLVDGSVESRMLARRPEWGHVPKRKTQ